MTEHTLRLKATQLYREADLSEMSFETTNDLSELHDVIGQPRAVEAIEFGTGITNDGFNIYALGPTGLDKRGLIHRFFESRARDGKRPSDWCYVHNFEQDHRPKAIKFPAGEGSVFRKDMEGLVEQLRTALPAAFESEEYQTRRQSVTEDFRDKHSEAFNRLQEQAREENMALIRTPSGIAVAPTREGEVLSPDEIQNMSELEQARVQEKVEDLQSDLQKILQQVPGWQREMRQELEELNRQMASLAVGSLIEELRKKHAGHEAVVKHLNKVQEDVVNNAEQFMPQPESGAAQMMMAMQAEQQEQALRRYAVNLLVDNTETEGAPVIYEDNPTYQNLVGRIEHRAQMGALMTDFMLIKPGALHLANGGYLVLDVRKLLTQPYAWEALKRSLMGRDIKVEPLGRQLSLISTVSLDPEPIPLQVKIALVGSRMIYYLLWQHDPEFSELFKVAADFDDEMDRNNGNQELYARLIATLVQRENLKPFDRGAVARVIERSSRMVGDSEKLSTRMREITDLLLESDYWSKHAGNGVVTGDDVQRAIAARIRRMDRMREKAHEAILRETLLISTQGEAVGQINGLSVMSLGDTMFGRPTRITARTQLGKGQVVDIEREVDLGGPLHSKGVLILTGFLTGRYAEKHPLSLSASLVFEQSYGGVDGDSASSAELYALLSSIAEVPIKQSFAVTGSVNQKGEVQAIGGVNDKIEGFFDICTFRGLTGDQGVLIPRANVKHLMLRQDVIEAVNNGQFHIYAVETIDQGIELLTGVPAGEADEDGNFPDDTINGKVQKRLAVMAERWRSFAKSDQEETSE
jgi:lon-related putative ATP-dependent protease